MNYKINKISDTFYQIYGDINGAMFRPFKPIIEGGMMWDFDVKYFDKERKLVRVYGKVYNEKMLKEKLDRIVEECNNENSKI